MLFLYADGKKIFLIFTQISYFCNSKALKSTLKAIKIIDINWQLQPLFERWGLVVGRMVISVKN